MKNHFILKLFTVTVLLSGIVMCLQAFSPPHAPQKAIEACSGKSQGAECRFNRPRGEMEGICQKRKKDPKQLVCMPTPPKVAIEACDNKKVGDSCTFTGKMNKAVSGTCHKMLNEDKLVCGRKPKFK